MVKRRVALITESTARKEEPTPAYLFYHGSYNKWVNAIVKYLQVREFPKEDAYFLSYTNQQIFGFEELVSWYEKTPDPNSKQRLAFAEKIIAFLQTQYAGDEIFVELHLSKLKYDKLIRLLEQHGYEYRLYADVSLGEKPNEYERLIMEETQYRKLREMKREKYNIVHLIPNKTPDEAKALYDAYRGKAHLHGVEDEFEQLKVALKDHWQAKKAVEKAKAEALTFIDNEDNEALISFFEQKDVIANLFDNVNSFEMLNQSCGKTMAKIERYLIKSEYLLQKENRLRAVLLRLQIALMKVA